ncbi:MAG: BrnA antitoxin family protein [Treponema sp.]|nr:BrnA antitoxin family protein [Treponema sp.]
MNGEYIMVRETLKAGQKPTKAQIREIRTAEKKTVVYTDDAPQLNNKELAEFKQINAENRKKIPCTLRLSKKSLEWWKSLGDGYTAAMARMLEDAQNHPEIIRKII